MVIRSLVVLALVVGIVQVAARAEEKRDWHMGKVLDSEKTDEWQEVVIGGDTHTYVARKWLSWHSKPANLTVNGPVKFAIEKRKLFLIDEDGNERSFGIIKKVLREQPDR